MSDENETLLTDDRLFEIPTADKVVNVDIAATSLTLILLMMVPATAAVSGDFTEAIIAGHTVRRFMDARPEVMEQFTKDIEKLTLLSCDAVGRGDKFREAMNAQR